MKFIKYIPATLCMLLILAGCKDDSANNPTFDDDEIPAIYMDWAAEYVYSLGDVMKFEAQVSPSDHTTCRWLIDGNVVAEGLKIEQTIDTEEPFTLRFEAERNGIKNFRTADVTIAKEFVAKEFEKVVLGVITSEGTSNHVQWDYITHLMYSSLVVKEDDGSLTLPDKVALDRFKTLVSLAHNQGIHVIVDISGTINYPTPGGVWDETAFNMAVIDPVRRTQLIADIKNFVEEYDLDGVNIYMNNINNSNSGLTGHEQIAEFMNELGAAFPEESDEGRRKFHITASVPMVWNNTEYYYLSSVERLDWVNFLLFGTSDLSPVPHAPDWQIDDNLARFAAQGIPASKAIVGIGAFGVRYDIPAGVNPSWGDIDNYLSYPLYSDILKLDANAADKDELPVGSGLFYTGAAGAVRKADITLANDALGMLIWMVEYDTSNADQSLTQAVYNHLNP